MPDATPRRRPAASPFAAGVLSFCLLIVLLPTALHAQEAGPERPNIVFIFSDDHVTQALGAYGGRLAGLDPTPNLDRRAGEGMLFRNAFVTNAICAPSRAVILTGKHSHLNGVETNQPEDSFPTILEVAGVPVPRNYALDGRSFAPLLVGEGSSAPDTTHFWHYPHLWGPQGPGLEPFKQPSDRANGS